MPTIYLDPADYVQRADDEGRDYHAGRTVRAALDVWRAVEPNSRDWHSTNADEPDNGPIAFATTDWGRSTVVGSVSPDEDIEGLYPAADLPFTIAAQPFPVGSRIRMRNASGQVWEVTGYNESEMRVRYEGGDYHDATGSVPPKHFDMYQVVTEVRYLVTVRGDHTATAVHDALASHLLGTVTVAPA